MKESRKLLITIITAVTLLQTLLLAASVLWFETFYFEMNFLLGLMVLTPAMALGSGLLVGWIRGKGNWRPIVAATLACVVAALPAFYVSNTLGQQVEAYRAGPGVPIPTPEMDAALEQFAREKGWRVLEAQTGQLRSTVVYEKNGQIYVAGLSLTAGTAGAKVDVHTSLARLAQAFGDFQGVPVTLRFASLDPNRYEAVLNGSRTVMVSIIDSPGAGVWHLQCQSVLCARSGEQKVPVDTLNEPLP